MSPLFVIYLTCVLSYPRGKACLVFFLSGSGNSCERNNHENVIAERYKVKQRHFAEKMLSRFVFSIYGVLVQNILYAEVSNISITLLSCSEEISILSEICQSLCDIRTSNHTFGRGIYPQNCPNQTFD